MAFRKNRSQHLWVFSAYSLALHLAGFLALMLLVGSQTPDSASMPISVTLVNMMPDTPQLAQIPTVPKASLPNTVAVSQTPSTPAAALPNVFHMIRRAETASPPKRLVTVGTNQHAYSIVQVASTVTTPEELTSPISRVDRIRELAHSSTHILVDHKAGQSLIATTPAKILFNPVPLYPRIARKLGLEGKTLLRVEILQDGRPGTVQVKKSCGHTVLDEAATKAIKRWKFSPAQDGLFAIRSVVDLPIRFSLKSLG